MFATLAAWMRRTCSSAALIAAIVLLLLPRAAVAGYDYDAPSQVVAATQNVALVAGATATPHRPVVQQPAGRDSESEGGAVGVGLLDLALPCRKGCTAWG